MLRLILLTPIESDTSTWKSLWSYCLFNCCPSVQVRVIKLIISPWFTTPPIKPQHWMLSLLNAQHLSVYAVNCTVPCYKLMVLVGYMNKQIFNVYLYVDLSGIQTLLVNPLIILILNNLENMCRFIFHSHRI